MDDHRLVPDAANVESRGAVTLLRITAPVLRRLSALLAIALIVAVAVAIYTGTRPHRYQAELSFSTVTPGRANSIAGSLPAALLAAASAGGLQASPALLSRLVRSKNVEVRVARMKVPGRADSTVADLLFQEQSDKFFDSKVADMLHRVVTTQNDRETGLVTVGASHRDSTLARFIVEKVVDEVTAAFQNAVKTQASETKSSVSQRLEAASERLRSVEQRSQEFAARNRVIAPFSAVAVERDRLAADLTLAQTLYNQVVSERELAKDRELEPVPTVVIVDPLPRELTPLPRQTVLKTVLAFAVSFLLLSAVFILVDLLRFGEMTPEQEREYFRNSVSEVPLLRSLVKSPASSGV